MNLPILYSFRRCPYAIRARMALAYAGVCVAFCEVDLKNKPLELLKASPKGTVPVLVLENGQVIDQSLDIMKWALEQSDPKLWKTKESECEELIHINDHHFKPILDNYKYPQKTESKDPIYYREQAKPYLQKLNELLKQHSYLVTKHITFADVAIFPFIRQFSMVDETWFKESEYTFLINWLNDFLESELFLRVMAKGHDECSDPPKQSS